MEENQNERDKIIAVLKEKSVLKQDVFEHTKKTFAELKEVLEETVQFIQSQWENADPRVTFHFKDHGEFHAEIKIAGDILVFFMHTNVFQFEQEHSLWRTSYLKEDPNRGFVGVINVYNFLADSFKFHRQQDLGYLIGRIFINGENHFMVQGKRQLGFLYNNFMEAEFDKAKMRDVVNSTILHTLDFDLYTPPYQAIQEVSVMEIQALSQHTNIATGKRLGFKFSHDEGLIE